MWAITPEERDKYDRQFDSLSPAQGVVSGDQAQKFFQLSGLPTPVLTQIWALADLNKDGKIDRQEFSIAMKLIKLKLQGQSLPATLPLIMKQSSAAPTAAPTAMPTRVPTAAPATTVSSAVPPPHLTTPISNSISSLPHGINGTEMANPMSLLNVGSNSSSSSASPLAVSADWAVPQPYQLKYQQMFHVLDKQKTGYLSGPQVRSALTASHLTQVQLATIWNLADVDKDGRLAVEEFILAMHLADMAKMGLPLPLTLPVKLVPPSARGRGSSDGTNGTTPTNHSGFSERSEAGLQKAEGSSTVAGHSGYQDREAEALRRRQLEQELKLERKREIERQKAEEQRRQREKEEAVKQELERQKELKLELKRKQELELKKRRELESSRNQEQQDVAQLKAKKGSLERELETVSNKHKEISDSLQDVRNKRRIRKTELDQINQKRSQWVKEISALEQQIEVFQKKLNKLVPEQQKLSERLHNIGLSNLTGSTVTMLKKSVNEKENLCRDLTEQLDVLEKDINSKLSEMDQNTQVIKKLKESQRKQQSALDKLSAIREEKLQEIESQKKQELEKKKREEEEADRQAKLEEERCRRLQEQREAALREEAERQRQEKLQREEEERQRQEKLRREEEERQRQEKLRREEEERQRQEKLQREEEERQRQEKLRREEEERQRQEKLQREEEERQRQEKLRREEEERQRQEKLRREEEERQRQEKLRREEEEHQRQEKLRSEEENQRWEKLKREELEKEEHQRMEKLHQEQLATQKDELLHAEKEQRYRAAEEERRKDQHRLVEEVKKRHEEQQRRATEEELKKQEECKEVEEQRDRDRRELEERNKKEEEAREEARRPVPKEVAVAKLKEEAISQHQPPQTSAKTTLKGKVAALLKGIEDRKGAKRENCKGNRKLALATYRALYNFTPRNPEELRFQAEDMIEVDESREGEKGWLYGYLRGSEGWFPVSYVEKQIKTEASPAAKQAVPPQIMPSTSRYSKPEEESGDPNLPADEGRPSAPEPVPAPTSQRQVATAPAPVLAPTAQAQAAPASVPGLGPTNQAHVAPAPAPGPAPATQAQCEPGPNLRAQALCSWVGDAEGRLSFGKDAVITVLERHEDWWLGELNGASGWFPKSFVTPLSPDGEQTEEPRPSVDGYGTLDSTCEEEYVALYTYDSPMPLDLTFNEGDTILVTERGGDWWKGSIGDRTGVFPSNYVKPKETDGGDAQLQNGQVPSSRVEILGSDGERSTVAPVQTPVCQVVAVYDYQAENQDEISFCRGQLINVLEKVGPDWWRGEINGVKGLFPTNYVQMTTGKDASQQGAADLETIGPQEKKRQDSIQELIETEERHLEDLQLAHEVFYKFMSEWGRMTEQELDTIFLNWNELITSSNKLIKAMKDRKKQSGENSPVQMIGDVLTSELSGMSAYVVFCTSQLKGAALLQRKTDEEPEFKDFLKKIATDYRCKGMPLASFLIKPMQRITRYPLIIKNILDRTPETHVDHAPLQTALETAERLCTQVNEGVRQKENEEQLEWLQSHVQCDNIIENFVFNSVTNCLGPRRLLHSGKVHNKSKVNKELYVFLFNDFLLFTSAAKQFSSSGGDKLFSPKCNMQFKIYKMPLFLNEVVVKLPSDASSEEPIFLISHINRVYTLKAESANERSIWVQKITAASEEFLDIERQKREKTYQGRSQKGSEIGRLLVTILEATGLQSCKANGKGNPFCEVTMGEQCYTSRTLNDTLNPKWNFNCQFFLKDLHKDVLSITIRERDQFSPDGFLGRTEVLLATIQKELENKGPANRRLLLHEVESGEVWVQLDLQLFEQK